MLAERTGGGTLRFENGRPERIGHATVAYAETREILTRATGFMDAYDYTLNPYAGCSFGCTYCYAAFFSRNARDRGDWGYWVRVKENAVDRLQRRRRSLNGKRIYMSSVTDPYQPVERKLGLTRGLLETLAEKHEPLLVVQTRSPDVVRDCDLYLKIGGSGSGGSNGAQASLLPSEPGARVQVNITVTTDDEDVRRTFEPYCPSNERRIEAARELQTRGVQTCITMTPLLWVDNPEAFADRLVAAGIRRFIIQPFHFQGGKFVAGTRDAALELMANKLDRTVGDFRTAYDHHYRNVRDILRSRLPSLGEGKAGFAPPF